MNAKTMISFALTVLTVLTFGLPTEVRAEHGQGGGRFNTPYLTVPPLVRFTGTLVASDTKDGTGIHTLCVVVPNNEWLFRLDKVEELNGPNFGWMLLSDLFPQELHFTGPDKMLQILRTAEQERKPVMVEGRLYVADRMLAVTDAEEVTTATE
jgi:hypothetical protein